MAFFSKAGSILKQSVIKQLTSQSSTSNTSIYQALRWMSSSKVYIGGLPYAVDDTSLREGFSQYGEVIDARVIIDREQNRSKGFGFVTFASAEEASSAVSALDGQDFQGRRVKVNFAAERPPRQFESGGYGGGGYGGGGYGAERPPPQFESGGYGGGQNYGGGGGYGGGGQNYGGGGGYGGGGQNYGGDGGYGGGRQNYGGGQNFGGDAITGNHDPTGEPAEGHEDKADEYAKRA